MKEEKKIKKKKRYNWLFRFLHCIVRRIFPYEVVGMETYYDDRNYIIVGNHYSMWDMLYPLDVTKNEIHYFCKDSLLKNPFSKWAIKVTKSIPVGRDGTDVKPVMDAMRYLKKGENIAIFPEGTRNKGDLDEMLPFKAGAAVLSIKTKTPIIPMVQITKAKVFRKHFLYVGDPIEFSEYYGKKLSSDDIAICEQVLRKKMIALRNEFKENYTLLTGKKKFS